MNWWFVFPAERHLLVSPLPPEECARRLKAQTEFTSRPWSRAPAFGRVSKSGFSLRLNQDARKAGNFAPAAYGRFQQSGEGTLIEVRIQPKRVMVLPGYGLVVAGLIGLLIMVIRVLIHMGWRSQSPMIWILACFILPFGLIWLMGGSDAYGKMPRQPVLGFVAATLEAQPFGQRT